MKFKYCPKCAGELAIVDGHPKCQSCGFIFFQNSKPTSSALILNDRNEVLLLKRAIEPYFGKWDIPGGFLEESEDPIDCLKRESREEMGIEIIPGEVIAIYVDRYGDSEDASYTFNVFYKCKIISGEIKLDKENSEYKWFAEKEIPWDELAFKNTAVAINALFKVR